jgi:hypothetical protein
MQVLVSPVSCRHKPSFSFEHFDNPVEYYFSVEDDDSDKENKEPTIPLFPKSMQKRMPKKPTMISLNPNNRHGSWSFLSAAKFIVCQDEETLIRVRRAQKLWDFMHHEFETTYKRRKNKPV